MKNILVVDDCRNFPFGDDCGMTVRTSGEALSALGLDTGGHVHLDELWLDFDLGGVFGRLERYDTAMPVVLYLAELAFFGRPYPVDRIIIHSANPVGSQAMLLTLQRYGYNVTIQEAHFGV